VDSKLTVEFLVSDFADTDVCTNSDSEGLFFHDFMDILEDLNNLRHDNDLLDDFFEKVGNLNNLFLSGEHGNDSFLNGRDSFNSSFDDISDVFSLDKLLGFDDFVLIKNNFLDFSVSSLDGDNLFFKDLNFLDLLIEDGDFDRSVSEFLNDVVDLYDDRNFNWELDNVRNLNDLLFKLLDFVYPRDIIVDGDQLFNDSGNLHYSVLVLNGGLNNLGLNFLNDFVHVRSDLFDFLDDFTYNGFFYSSHYLFDSHLFYLDLNNCFDFLNDLNNFLDFSVNWDNDLNDLVNGNRHFDGDNGRPFDFDDLFDFNNFGNDSVHLDFSWDFHSGFYNFF